MKKTLFLLTIFLLSLTSTFASTEQDQNAASFLAGKNIIAASSDYKLNSTITRREMLKVMMNLSGKPIASTCSGKFKDLPSSDWGCKYAEAALVNGYISANSYFRPNDSITGYEALKMIMKARNISPVWEDYGGEVADWKRAYQIGAMSQGNYILGIGGDLYKMNQPEYSLDYNLSALRGFVFLTAARTYNEFVSNIDNWRTYNSEKFSFKYPENWVYQISENTTLIGINVEGGHDRVMIQLPPVSFNYDKTDIISQKIVESFLSK